MRTEKRKDSEGVSRRKLMKPNRTVEEKKKGDEALKESLTKTKGPGKQ